MQVPAQVQRGSGEGSECSGEGLGGFGAEPGHVQQGSGEGSGEGLGGFGARARSGSTGFRRKVPGQVQQASEEGSGEGSGGGSGEGLGGFGAEPGQVQQGSGKGSGEGLGGFGAEPGGSTGFRRRFRRKSGRVWCKARSGATGF